MIEKTNIQLEYAFDVNGKLVHIDAVTNGSACNCTCPYCKKPLIARNEGKKNAHHFAHQGSSEDADDRKCYDYMFHLRAEEVLLNLKRIKVPDAENPNKGIILEFVDIKLEHHDSETNKRPDIVGKTSDGKEYWIEIWYTHKVDDAKRQIIRNKKINAIEVDVRDCEPSDESLGSRYLDSPEKKEWIYYDELERVEEKHNHTRSLIELEERRIREEQEEARKIAIHSRKKNFHERNSKYQIHDASYCSQCPYSTVIESWNEFVKKYNGRVSPKMQQILDMHYDDVKALGLHWEYLNVRHMTSAKHVDFCTLYPYDFCTDEIKRTTNNMALALMNYLERKTDVCRYRCDFEEIGGEKLIACKNPFL